MPRRQKNRSPDTVTMAPPHAPKPGRDAINRVSDHALAFAVDLPRRALGLAILGAVTGVAAAKSVTCIGRSVVPRPSTNQKAAEPPC